MLILLEFQSRDDPDMALRILEYTTLLYRELRRNRALESDGRRPPVLPVVLYNGDSPWRAAVEVGDLITPVSPALARYQPAQRYVLLDERHVRSDDALASNLMGAVVALEQSRDPQDLRRVVAALEQRAWDPQDEELSRVFAEWVWRLAQRLAPEETPPPAAYTLAEVRMTLEERVSRWPRQWRQDGLDQGLRQGLDQGLRQGLDQGLQQQRALLRRQAASRFGADAAGRLADVLEAVTEPERIAEIGELIVRCERADELLAEIATAGDTGEEDDWS